LNLQDDHDKIEYHDEFSQSFSKKSYLANSRIKIKKESLLTESEEEITHLKKEKSLPPMAK